MGLGIQIADHLHPALTLRGLAQDGLQGGNLRGVIDKNFDGVEFAGEGFLQQADILGEPFCDSLDSLEVSPIETPPLQAT